jgi:hypothetical protein
MKRFGYSGCLLAAAFLSYGGVASAQGSCEQQIEQLQSQLRESQLAAAVEQQIAQQLDVARGGDVDACRRIVMQVREQLREAAGAEAVATDQHDAPELARETEVREGLAHDATIDADPPEPVVPTTQIQGNDNVEGADPLREATLAGDASRDLQGRRDAPADAGDGTETAAAESASAHADSTAGGKSDAPVATDSAARSETRDSRSAANADVSASAASAGGTAAAAEESSVADVPQVEPVRPIEVAEASERHEGDPVEPPVVPESQYATDDEPDLVLDASDVESDAPTQTVDTAVDDRSSNQSEGDATTLETGSGAITRAEAEALLGDTLIAGDGEEVGQIKDVAEGKADAQLHAVVELRGFLGIGKRTVSIPLSHAQIQPDDKILLQMTSEEIRQMPDYDPAQYATLDEGDRVLR